MEAEPETKPVRQRHLLLDRFARVDRGRAFVLDHFAGEQVPPVRGGVEDDVVGTSLDTAFQHRLQRFVGGIVAVEGEVVAEHDEAEIRAAEEVHQAGQALDVLAVDLDQLQPVGLLAVDVDIGVSGLHQRRLAHAARAPQQRVVRGQPVGKALGVFDQDVPHPVDAFGESRPSGCQTKASAEPNDLGVAAAGEAAERWPAMASSAVAIRSAVAPLRPFAGRFVAVFATAREAALEVARAAV